MFRSSTEWHHRTNATLWTKQQCWNAMLDWWVNDFVFLFKNSTFEEGNYRNIRMLSAIRVSTFKTYFVAHTRKRSSEYDTKRCNRQRKNAHIAQQSIISCDVLSSSIKFTAHIRSQIFIKQIKKLNCSSINEQRKSVQVEVVNDTTTSEFEYQTNSDMGQCFEIVVVFLGNESHFNDGLSYTFDEARLSFSMMKFLRVFLFTSFNFVYPI